MGRLELNNLTVGYGGKPLISDLSLTVENGEMVSLLGPSGAGKTTLLKTIAGLLQPASGELFLDGTAVTSLPAEERDIVLIFQKALLFPFMNVTQNIGFGLRMQGIRGREAKSRINAMVKMTGLDGLEQRNVHELSGGQQQRVALARGLVVRPSVLLMDEPLSNLDAGLRQQMRELIRSVQIETGITTVFVTHDQTEALTISDRICVLLEGRLRQTGTPQELFYHPVDAAVAEFFGCDNLLDGTIQAKIFTCALGALPIESPDTTFCTVAIRPEDILLFTQHTDGTNRAVIKSVRFEGSHTRLRVRAGSFTLTVLTMHSNLSSGQEVWLQLPANKLHCLHNPVQGEP